MPEVGSMLTFPQYAINLYEVACVVAKLSFDSDFTAIFMGYKSLGVFVFNVGFMFYAMGIIGMLTEKVFAGFFKKGK